MARTSVATDDFNRANEDPLSGGGNWTELNSGWGSIVLASNVVYGDNAATNDQRQASVWSGAGSFDDDQYAKIAISGSIGWQNDNYSLGVIVRASTDTGANRDYYEAIVKADGESSYTTELNKVVNGTFTNLHSASLSWGDGDTIELEVTGQDSATRLTVYKNGVSLGGSFEDVDPGSTYLNSGKPGIAGAGQSGIIDGDNWEGGNLGSGPVITDVNTTESWQDGATGLLITGTGFVG